jgi:hypothetical protein
MLVSKLKNNALGASGMPLPDRPTQDALAFALTAEAQGAGIWSFRRDPVLTADIVREVPSAAKENHGAPDVYRLTVSCREDNHEASLQLAWSPGLPQRERPITVAMDGKPPVAYKLEGAQPGSLTLPAVPLPQTSLAVSDVFADEKVVFPFTELNPGDRKALESCIAP